MSKSVTRPWGRADYERAAEEYQASLPLEHYMEGRPQATQREITLASLAQVRQERPAVQVFNEMLVQYFYRGNLRQVVPDNMVVLSDQPVEAVTCYNIEFESAPLFWTLEYVSASAKQKRKDYELNIQRYERELRATYYLIFDPETQDLRLHRRRARGYRLVKPNAQGRLEIPDLEVEVALVGGWVRFWYQGGFLELPGVLSVRVKELGREIALERKLREEERKRADDERKRADDECKRADDERKRADDERKLREEERKLREEERKRADAAEAETALLRALIESMKAGRGNGTVP